MKRKSTQVNNRIRLEKTAAEILLITEYDVSKNMPLSSGKKGGRSVGILGPLTEKVV
jgi:hypothetical protein